MDYGLWTMDYSILLAQLGLLLTIMAGFVLRRSVAMICGIQIDFDALVATPYSLLFYSLVPAP